jgi:hypothetical protein
MKVGVLIHRGEGVAVGKHFNALDFGYFATRPPSSELVESSQADHALHRLSYFISLDSAARVVCA